MLEHAPEPDDPLALLVEITLSSHEQIEELIALIRDRKQVIFQGPPGSGKTWIAEKLARYLTDNPMEGDDTNDRLELVQFHQSYGYEDFVQGIRPITVGGAPRVSGLARNPHAVHLTRLLGSGEGLCPRSR